FTLRCLWPAELLLRRLSWLLLRPDRPLLRLCPVRLPRTLHGLSRLPVQWLGWLPGFHQSRLFTLWLWGVWRLRWLRAGRRAVVLLVRLRLRRVRRLWLRRLRLRRLRLRLPVLQRVWVWTRVRPRLRIVRLRVSVLGLSVLGL